MCTGKLMQQFFHVFSHSAPPFSATSINSVAAKLHDAPSFTALTTEHEGHS